MKRVFAWGAGLGLLLGLYVLSFGPASVLFDGNTTPDTFLYQFYYPLLEATQVPILGDVLQAWAALWERLFP